MNEPIPIENMKKQDIDTAFKPSKFRDSMGNTHDLEIAEFPYGVTLETGANGQDEIVCRYRIKNHTEKKKAEDPF